MSKSGRVWDVVDADGRGAKRRRRSRIRGVIRKAGVGILAVGATLLSVVYLLALGRDQSGLNAYDKAPYCVTATTDTTSCVLRTTANVGYVDVSKNTGKNAHGYTTKVDLEPAANIGRDQLVELSDTADLSGSVVSGDTIPVLVWHSEITRFTFSGKTRDADANPHHRVAMDLGISSLFTAIAFLAGRPLIRQFQRGRLAINLQRNRIPDWTLVVLVVLVMPMAALLRASDAVILVGWAGLLVLAGSVAWPFIPWVATVPEIQRPLGGSQASYAAAYRKRTQAKKRLP